MGVSGVWFKVLGGAREEGEHYGVYLGMKGSIKVYRQERSG